MMVTGDGGGRCRDGDASGTPASSVRTIQWTL